ncbi:hypothetical protein NFI96_007252 [Prochilodus magdalenae]|nr:hypothetical protein NFI96_007252 [Prochilodus magdalenae]
MKEVWGAMTNHHWLQEQQRQLSRWGVDRANQFNNFYNRVSCRRGRQPALISSPQEGTPERKLNDYRPVALTSHVMKTMERLLLNHLRPQVHHAEDPLQFVYREKVGVEDAILYLLHRAHSHLDKGGGAVRVMFFDFSSAFNTIQPLLLRDKLMKMEVDMHLVTWITDYLTGRPQHVRIRDRSSDTVISSTGAPQGTVLSPVLFTLYTSDFKYNSELCHMQKFSDDTAIVGCVRNGQEREYRSLVEDFVEWCTTNHLKLNITKTKEMCIDFRRSRPSQQPISIKGVDVEVVRSYRYLGVHLDERLDWICQKLLLMFYQSVVASVLFYAVVCWGGSISKRDAGRLDRLVRKAGSVLGLELESLTPLAERRALNKLLNIMDNVHHPLHTTIIRQRSSFSGRDCCTHSLDFYLTGVTTKITIPEFTIVAHVDELEAGCYNSDTRKVILTRDWIKDNDDTEHWDFMLALAQSNEDSFRSFKSYLMGLFNQTEGIHTVQWTEGCELDDDGTKRGYSRFGYDGEDFLSLDVNTLTWTAANDVAVVMKQKLEQTDAAASEKTFLETACIEWLWKYVDYGNKTLNRTS